MPTIEDRVSVLELRVDHLVTWAGPGQAEALGDSLHQTRADLAKIQHAQEKLQRAQEKLQRTQDQMQRTLDGHSGQLSGLVTDVAVLKTDMAEMKGAVQEILRRMPAA